MMSKEMIRNQIRTLKRKLTIEQMVEQSDMIANQLYNTQEYQAAAVIYTYKSYNQEVITNDIILHALAHDKKVAVPKVEKDKIVFYYIDGLQDVEIGYQGILEPINKRKAEDTQILMVMPGLAFDLTGNRMGYGAGFYDKYLKEHENDIRVKIALAYDFQVIEQLKVEQHDQKVDMIVTVSKVIRCKDI